jgi:SAM-dependent methyltransferase
MPHALDPELLAAARYARSLAGSTCLVDASGRSCAWYHGAWPFFRLVEIVSTPKKHAAHFESELRCAKQQGECRRVLISGSADDGMLRMIADSSAGWLPAMEFTVIDRCATPLRLCERFAERRRLRLTTIQRNILDAAPAAMFDAILTHGFLGYFTAAELPVLLLRWRSLLRPGGRLVMVQRIREQYAGDRVRFTPAEAAAFIASVERLSAPYTAELGADDLPTLARRYVANMDAWSVRSAQGLRRTIEANGFRLLRFERSEAQRASAITGPAVPNSAGYHMITAERV